jgi:hypothetical protein
MKKQIIALYLLLLAIPVIYYYHVRKYDRITTITSFSHYDFSTITPCDLIVFDIDETLIQPTDSYLIHRNSTRGKLLLSLFGLYNNEFDVNHFHETRLQHANRILIEPFIIPTIQTLQANNIPVIGCTAMRTGLIKTLVREDWRYQDLKSLGFEGSWADKIIMLDSLPGRQLFYKGCIFTDLYDKGPALAEFLNTVSFKPKKIIFFDDCVSYLESIRKMCDAHAIAFEGYLYQGLQSKPWNTQLSVFQLNHVAQNKSWLPDEKALQQLNGINMSPSPNEW